MFLLLATVALVLSAASIIAVAAPAYAQTSLTVDTDRNTYAQGDYVMVFGRVNNVVAGTPLQLQIFNPDNTLSDVDQQRVALDGTFSSLFRTGGEQWLAGTYTVKVSYAGELVEANFDVTAGRSLAPSSDCTRVVEGMLVDCTIAGGTLLDIRPDVAGLSLLLIMQTDLDGTVTVTLPTTLIESTATNGSPADFIVRIDGVQVEYRETANSVGSRTLQVDFFAGDNRIEIIGTKVVPEFGVVVMLILSLGLIAVAAAGRLGMMPASKVG